MSSYVYCADNPVNYVDPDGKAPKDKTVIVLNAMAKLSTFEKAWKNSRHGDYTTEEWQFTISLSENQKYYIARNLYTDGLEDGIFEPHVNVPITEKLIGYVHTHQYSRLVGSTLGMTFSASDIFEIKRSFLKYDISLLRGMSTNYKFFHIVEAGNKRFALVVEDNGYS